MSAMQHTDCAWVQTSYAGRSSCDVVIGEGTPLQIIQYSPHSPCKPAISPSVHQVLAPAPTSTGTVRISMASSDLVLIENSSAAFLPFREQAGRLNMGDDAPEWDAALEERRK